MILGTLATKGARLVNVQQLFRSYMFLNLQLASSQTRQHHRLVEYNYYSSKALIIYMGLMSDYQHLLLRTSHTFAKVYCNGNVSQLKRQYQSVYSFLLTYVLFIFKTGAQCNLGCQFAAKAIWPNLKLQPSGQIQCFYCTNIVRATFRASLKKIVLRYAQSRRVYVHILTITAYIKAVL